MRTTVELPDPLLRRAKATAALRGMSLKRLFIFAVEREVDAPASRAMRGRNLKFPLVRSKHPGSVPLTSERVAELLDAEDAHVSSRR